MTDQELDFEGSEKLSTEQMIDIKSMTLGLYLFAQRFGSVDAFKVMVSYAAKTFSDKWELPIAAAEALIGQALSLLMRDDWVHVMINRDGKFTHAASASPQEVNDDERMMEFFREGLAIAPPRPAQRIIQ